MSALSERALGAIATLRNFPKALRDDVVDLPGFKQAFDIPAEAEITFGGNDLRFLRSTFFTALRKLYADRTSVCLVQTEDGRSGELSLRKDGDLNVILCKIDDQCHQLPGFTLISPVTDDRLMEFDRLASRDNLRDPSALAWRVRLAEGGVSDEELSRLIYELEMTPLKVMQRIRENVAAGEALASTVVPHSLAYYDRLVGSSLGYVDLASFVQGSCKAHIADLMNWNFARGLSFSLLLSGHSTISELIDVGDRSSTEVEQTFGWLAERGDRFSQIAGIELGVRIFDRYPGITASLTHMIEEIRDEDPTAKDSRFALTASLFVLVDGELSRRGLLSDKLPFWRRLAAMAHGSLLERELIEAQLDIPAFLEWATQGRGLDFYMQALADLRLEPRWLPDFMTPERLKDEAISRIVSAGERLKNVEGAGKLHALLKGEDPSGVRAFVRFPQCFLPGPLEGNTVPAHELPAEFIDVLREKPESGLLSSQSLAGLVNSALVFRIGEEHSRLAAEALKKVRHQVTTGGSDGEAFSVLAGLALVAAVTRGVDLARDVRILARVLRRRTGIHFEVEELLRVGLIASAANREVVDWSQAVGEWFEELAFEPMSVEDAEKLRRFLHKLRAKVPELWKFCTKADAALAAVARAA